MNPLARTSQTLLLESASGDVDNIRIIYCYPLVASPLILTAQWI